MHGSSNGTPARRADGLSLKRRDSKEWRTIIDGEKMQHHTRTGREGGRGDRERGRVNGYRVNKNGTDRQAGRQTNRQTDRQDRDST